MAGRHRKPAAPLRGSGRHRRPTNTHRWVAPALVVALVVGIVAVGTYALSGAGDAGPGSGPHPTATKAASSAPVTSTSAPTAAAAPTPTGSPVSAPVRHRTRGPAVGIAVTGQVSWVHVALPNGRVLFSGLLRHGHRLVYGRGPLSVVIGDAGAVRLTRGTKVLRPAGRSGQVLRFRVR
jgi:hypothetical protein